MKTITNKFKIAIAAIGLLAVGSVSAQTADPSDGVAQTDAAGQTIRLIDNKGTIKYLQSNNGITTITSTETGNLTTTTWQLGGALTENTYIDVDGNTFGFNGITTATNSAATSITSGGDGTAGATETGFALLVREEATGETKKLLVSDLVASGSTPFTGSDVLTGTFDITVTGMPASPSVVWVYRNGAKLLASEYNATVAGTVTVTVNPGSGVSNWVSYAGDAYEVYWVK